MECKGREIEQFLSSKWLNESEDKSCSLLERFSYYFFDSVDSTMTVAQELLSEAGRAKYQSARLAASGSSAGSDIIVLSNKQTNGRGTNQRSWYSQPTAGLYLTLGYKVPNHFLSQTSLSLVVGYAIYLTLCSFDIEARLKWPNDVLIYCAEENLWKKIAGVLIESSTQGDKGHSSIRIGIGLNVNQDSFPDEVPGISMAQIRDLSFEPSLVFSELVWQVHTTIESFFKEGFCVFREEWIRSSMMFEQLFIMKTETADEGVCIQCQSVADDGALIVRDICSDSQIISVYSGEFEIVKHTCS